MSSVNFSTACDHDFSCHDSSFSRSSSSSSLSSSSPLGYTAITSKKQKTVHVPCVKTVRSHRRRLRALSSKGLNIHACEFSPGASEHRREPSRSSNSFDNRLNGSPPCHPASPTTQCSLLGSVSSTNQDSNSKRRKVSHPGCGSSGPGIPLQNYCCSNLISVLAI